MQIESMREQMQELRQQIQSSKRDNGSLSDKNTKLHYAVGEKNEELAALRGDTSK